MSNVAPLSSAPIPDHSEADRFLRLLDPLGEAFAFATLDDVRQADGKPRDHGRLRQDSYGSLAGVLSHLHRLNTKFGAAIYVVINKTNGQGRRDADIVRKRAFWTDLDGGLPRGWFIPPSIIVQTSPGKYQAYWLFDGDISEAEFLGVLRNLQLTYGGDPGAISLSRILRLPGFLHQKAEPFRVKLIDDNGRRYSVAEVTAAHPPVIEKRESEPVPETIIETERNRTLFQEAGKMRRNGLAVEEIEPALQAMNLKRCSPPLDEKEVTKVAKSIGRYASGQFGKDGRLIETGTGSEAEAFSWEDPDMSLIEDRRGELPEIPLNALTPTWHDWAERASHGAGVRPDHVILPKLVTASSLIGCGRMAKAGTLVVPLHMWGALVGYSGSGKSPGMNVARGAASAVEAADKGRIAELRREHDTRIEAAKAAEKQWKAAVIEATANGQPPPMQPPEAVVPGPFIEPRIVLNDTTIEAVAALLTARPSGLLLVKDELVGLFRNMSRYSNGDDRQFWLEAWDGNSYNKSRKSGHVCLPHLCVGMIGGFQPDKLGDAFAGDDDGMSARMLFAWPERAGYRQLANSETGIDPVLYSVFSVLTRLGASSRPVPLSTAALNLFEVHRRGLFGDDGLLHKFEGLERSWLAKGDAHVLRLAGTLHYLDWATRAVSAAMFDPAKSASAVFAGHEPEPAEIGFEPMLAAVRLWHEYLWPHARAVLRMIGAKTRNAVQCRVLHWIRAHKLTEVAVKDIRRQALPNDYSAKDVEQVLGKLATAGWLKKIELQKDGPGRPAVRWQVNPLLRSGHRGD
jgi:hypothetical protein